ncbi:haloacid dehalogenase [Acrocarpospora corrugata]|uniref:Haloacid dehalogenase n=1 Tax=Acrocarpospora corrugata TaxID=35763 RepID=A0A5M3W5K6_9ACTN|nr:HAD family phosphatase [Acrocarpospora corrugata]GES04074.1 haloacid dehalogenase [Acrocarpospora corrugata]
MDAVLFDMDGLLVDTEKVWFEVETEVVERLGGSWGPEHGAALVGGSWDRTVAYMLDLTGSDAPPDEVARWLLDGMVERLLVEVEPMPGALELLAELNDAGVRTGLVTSSLKPVADAVLDVVGRDRFAIVVTADDVARTKPDPEPYLTAARLLSARPECCAVLEDSPNGVAAATAAGCRVVAVPSVVPIPAAPGRLVVPSLLEVDLNVLRALF